MANCFTTPAQRILNCSKLQNTTLTPDKAVNVSIYGLWSTVLTMIQSGTLEDGELFSV